MRHGARIAVIIPALNEERAVGNVIDAVPGWVDEIVVVNNGSTDRTVAVARAHGARVVNEARRGYGSACIAGLAAIKRVDVVVFLDGDFSDRPEEMSRLVDPIVRDGADMVLGSRVRGNRDPGALTPQARFGNWLACGLVRLFWDADYTDLGPFRAIRYVSLMKLGMRDRDYGWTIEMQVKAVRWGLRVKEVPVSYRRRIGKSKISGTVRGSICAGVKILLTILRATIAPGPRPGKADRRARLIVFTRYPEPGSTKKRLIPTLGAKGAAELQRQMTGHTLRQAKRFGQRFSLSLEVRFDGGAETLMRRSFGTGLVYRRQSDGDLGRRMWRAFDDAFAEGLNQVVVIGTDCPELSSETLARAFEALQRSDAVVGPAGDGGYYLVGLRRPASGLFEGIAWGTADVLQMTLRAAERLGLSLSLLEQLEDVDLPDDLPVWEKVKGRDGDGSLRGPVSIVVPALNEEGNVGAALESVRSASDAEVIVVDGGSEDRTVEEARAHGAKVLICAAGKAQQMNAGAAEATGQALLFLHADTRLPADWEQHVRRALSAPGAVAGAFQLGIDSTAQGMRFIENAVNLRSVWLQMPYGDQAIFIKTKLFREMGGFPDMPIMEDFELMRRVRRRGRVIIVPASVATSPRRWRTLGRWRAAAINKAIILGYYLGISPSRLARWYDPNAGVS